MRLIDAHTHMELLALKTVPFENIRSVEELADFLKRSDVRIAWGWDESMFGRPLLRRDIDPIDRPILLLRMDAHVGVANRRLIEELGIKGGELFDEERGYLRDSLLWEIVDRLKPRGSKMRELLRQACMRAGEMGIAEVHDFVDYEIALHYLELSEELPIRVVLMPYYEHYRDVLELMKGKRYENISLGWVKLFVDGSVGARTAYLKEPYKDRKGWRGNLFVNAEDIERVIRELEEEGLRVALHAIGDGAVEECLRAFEKAKPRLKYHRIEHALLIDREQAIRAKEMNLLLCLQPNFRDFFKDTYITALGEERFGRVVPLDMLDSLGVDMIFGSDMMPFDLLYMLSSAERMLPREKALYYCGGWSDEKSYQF